jgi:hypothetical protein
MQDILPVVPSRPRSIIEFESNNFIVANVCSLFTPSRFLDFRDFVQFSPSSFALLLL